MATVFLWLSFGKKMGKVEIKVKEITIGKIVVKNCVVMESEDSFKNKISKYIKLMPEMEFNETLKKRVRDMLRFGKYKPSGRGKPASEYLWESAKEGKFPFINNFVDALNFVSLKSGLPISLIDNEKAGTMNFRIRRGSNGEKYVFNQSGQILDLEDLLLTATLEKNEPVATPVKDSQKTKIDEKSKEITAIIYSPFSLENDLKNTLFELTEIYEKMGEVDEPTLF